MPTTTIRIDDALKERVTAAAERAGKTTHAFILDVISETVDRSDQEQEFLDLAHERWRKLLATGETIGWDETKAWVEGRLRGNSVDRPKPRRVDR